MVKFAWCGNGLESIPLTETGQWEVRVRILEDWADCYGLNPDLLTGDYTLTVCTSNGVPAPITYGQVMTASFTAGCQIYNFDFDGKSGDMVTVTPLMR